MANRGVPEPRSQSGGRRPVRRRRLPTGTTRRRPSAGPRGPGPAACGGSSRRRRASAPAGRQGRLQPRPLLGEERGYAPAEQPVELGAASRGHAEEDQLGDAVRVVLGPGQGQGAAPRSAENQPPVDLQVPAQGFHVLHERPGGVAPQAGGRIAGVGGAPPAAPLIEEHDAVHRWIEERAVPGGAPRTGAPVEDDGRLAEGMAAGLPVDPVAVPDGEHPVLVRFDLRIRIRHGRE